MVIPAASLHSTFIHLYFSFFRLIFYSVGLTVMSDFPFSPPSSFLPLRFSAECQDRSVEHEQDKGQWSPWLISRSHCLFPSCPPHFWLCSFSFSNRVLVYQSVFYIFVHMLLLFLLTFYSCFPFYSFVQLSTELRITYWSPTEGSERFFNWKFRKAQ